MILVSGIALIIYTLSSETPGERSDIKQSQNLNNDATDGQNLTPLIQLSLNL